MGTYDVEVAGTTVGTHDQLDVAGNVAYGGASLNVINIGRGLTAEQVTELRKRFAGS